MLRTALGYSVGLLFAVGGGCADGGQLGQAVMHVGAPSLTIPLRSRESHDDTSQSVQGIIRLCSVA
jgi:hypothetical protein